MANLFFDTLSKKDFDSVQEEIVIYFPLLLPMHIGIASSLRSLRLGLFRCQDFFTAIPIAIGAKFYAKDAIGFFSNKMNVNHSDHLL